MDIEMLKYPVGKYKKPETLGKKVIEDATETLQKFPALLKEATSGLSKTELEYKHRPEGWTVRQLVHHCADSHMNAFIRIKVALTEDNPTIKPYLENEFAKLKDTTEAPIEWSLITIEGIHNRLVTVLKAMNDSDFERTYFHPQYKSTVFLKELTGLYAWHCNHHLAHIKQALKYKNNF
jgi:hypothetical protein